MKGEGEKDNNNTFFKKIHNKVEENTWVLLACILISREYMGKLVLIKKKE